MAVSSRGGIGLTQIRARVWRTCFDFSRINLFSPWDNVHMGAVIMADLIRRHGLRDGLQHYNGGMVGCSTCAYGYSTHVLALAGASAELSPAEQKKKTSRFVDPRGVGGQG